jgi:hypothetical protein
MDMAARRARERIIATEMLKLEWRQAQLRSQRRARPLPRARATDQPRAARPDMQAPQALRATGGPQ